ncbi:MAG TPA: type II secretion system protein [Patescibacteria group bacterium]|nr:type II secretion system protein [Patescibacteria group bacterium]
MMIKSYQRGQSLFELVIAIGISALIIVVLVSLVSNSLQNASFAKNETLAGRLAQEATEWLRGQRDSDINTFTQSVATPFNVARCFNALVWTAIGGCSGDTIPGTPFTREITFTSKDVVIGGDTKTIVEAEVVVSWTDSKGLHQVTNATDFADWRQR